MQELKDALSKPFRVIDISQPVSSESAFFPGDTPFSRQVTVSLKDSEVLNLTALTMSPHIGTHVDAPVHIRGSMDSSAEMVGALPLAPFIGPVEVVDIAPYNGAIDSSHLKQLSKGNAPRILIRTRHHIRYQVFENDYAYFATELIDWFRENNIVLAGLDTPSVDETTSKTLDAHHRLVSHNICWLENLDLTNAPAGEYFLIALPLKFMELEASPVRAILLDWTAR